MSPRVVLQKDRNLDEIAAKVLAVSDSNVRKRIPRQVFILSTLAVSKIYIFIQEDKITE